MEYLMNRRFAMFVRYLVMECLTSLVANIARAYSSFCSKKQLVVLLVPLDGMIVHYIQHNLDT